MAQDNKQKMETIMPGVENAAGNESGETTLIPQASYQPGHGEINGTASSENLGAKWRGGAQDVPEAGKNQYQ